jgi:uncharacterized protein YkwD
MLAALLLALLAAPAGSPAPASESRPSAATALSAYEVRLLERINAVRARQGRGALRASAALTAAADYHSARMLARGFFEHEAPGERSFSERIARFYPQGSYDYWAVGENLAYGAPRLEPGEAVQGWLHSPGHRRNMLWPRWREVGISVRHAASAPGTFGGDAVTVVTVDFGVRLR